MINSRVRNLHRHSLKYLRLRHTDHPAGVTEVTTEVVVLSEEAMSAMNRQRFS